MFGLFGGGGATPAAPASSDTSAPAVAAANAPDQQDAVTAPAAPAPAPALAPLPSAEAATTSTAQRPGRQTQKPQLVDEDFGVDLEARLLGTVVSYWKLQGYGFIKLTQEGLVPNDMLFVHWQNIVTSDRFPALAKDIEVEVSVLKWKDRWNPGKVTLRARNVTKPGGDPIALQDEVDREQKEFVGGQDLRYTGTVKFYNQIHGYGYVALDPGFVVEPDVPGELRVDCIEVNSAGRQPGQMQQGLAVEFGIWKTKRGNYKVYNMTLSGGIPITQDVLEHRQNVGSQTFHGEVHMWNWRQGWGFIKADPATTLPPEVCAKLAQQSHSAAERAATRGKTVLEEELLYFRKHDVQQGVRLDKGAQVMFRVYTDDKGAGALDIATI